MRLLFTLVVVAVAVVGAPARAHVAVPTEFREVVSESSLIVRGRVTDVRSVLDADDRIESIATVAVENVLKGQATGFVYIRVPGGEVGRSRVVMVGAPTFRPGQRAVFFLKSAGGDPSLRPIGLSMGVYFVQAEPRTGRPVIAPPLVAGSTTSRTGPAVRGDTRRRSMPIGDFEALVRLVIATTQAQAVRRGGAR
jgi:hypothetical protein